MAKSKIIKDLILNTINEEVAINRLLLIGLEVEDDEITKWAESELMGYKVDQNLPNYRKFHLGVFKYSGINGDFTIPRASLQSDVFENTLLNSISKKCVIMDGVKSIKRIIESETGSMNLDLSDLIGYVREKSGIQCTSLYMQFPLSVFENALSGMKNSLIKALVKLEQSFGNLDEFDIKFDAIKPETIKNTIDEVTRILYADDGSSF